MIVSTTRHSALFSIVLAAVLGTGFAALPLYSAVAQLGMPGGPLSNVGPTGAANLPGQGAAAIGNSHPAVAPPEALPGAKRTAPAAPATKLPTDMSPNDALFDAINRGDLAAAHDAINRGADMDARNILGMTPMELSIDLGRNDISFLLLSLRPEGEGPVSTAAVTSPQSLLSGKPSAVKRVAATAKKMPQAPVLRQQQPTAPRLFANDGGTPNPSAGFLGFGPGNAAR
jgi:hypothetical protein